MKLNNSLANSYFINPLKSRTFLIFIALHFALILALHLTFGDNFILAPDERGYLQVALDIYRPGYEYIQWGWPWRTPLWFMQVIYLPFRALSFLGIPDLIALRITSSLYSTVPIYLILCQLKRYKQKSSSLKVNFGGAVGLVDTYNLDRVSREGSTNDKALSAGVSR